MEVIDITLYNAIVKVKDKKGTCVAGHEVGDIFEISGKLGVEDVYRIVNGKAKRGRICGLAFVSLYPQLLALRLGAEIHWAQEGKILVSCPDAINLVIFEMEKGKQIERGKESPSYPMNEE